MFVKIVFHLVMENLSLNFQQHALTLLCELFYKSDLKSTLNTLVTNSLQVFLYNVLVHYEVTKYKMVKHKKEHNLNGLSNDKHKKYE